MYSQKPDKLLFIIVLLLVLGGLFIFMSASFGLFARTGATFGSVAFNQIVLGLLGGSVAGLIVYKINYKYFQKLSFLIFAFSIVLTALVLIPSVGFSYGGARRWLDFGFVTFQPAEFLKISFVLAAATWYRAVGSVGAKTIKRGLVPMLSALALIGAILLAQPDTGTFLIIFGVGIFIYFLAGAKWKHLAFILLISIIGFLIILLFRPYVVDRVMTFLDPSRDPLGSSYQIRQSMVAIGSGGLLGRGFGQSVQKFNYLPEPIGDSIFAVLAEEFGFIGSMTLTVLFAIFGLRGIKIASKIPDLFGRLVVSGIVIMIVAQSFLNISAMINIVPLTGLPLIFISHGGTALFFALLEVGIVLNISRYQRLTTN